MAPVLLLVALAVLVVGLARPARAEAVPREQGVVVLALDVSASMEATDVAPTRLQAAIAGATELRRRAARRASTSAGRLRPQRARVVVAPTTDHAARSSAPSTALTTGPGTASGEGLYSALASVESVLSPDLLASGEDLPASDRPALRRHDHRGPTARRRGPGRRRGGRARVDHRLRHPRGHGDRPGRDRPVPADPVSLAAAADATGGTAFEAASGIELEQVYAQIRSAVGSTTEQREVTRGLLGGAFALALAGIGLSLVLNARPL